MPKEIKEKIIKRLYNQIIDNQRKIIYPLFDPEAHTRYEKRNKRM